jgi:6-phospho-3-hexuloisomerase
MVFAMTLDEQTRFCRDNKARLSAEIARAIGSFAPEDVLRLADFVLGHRRIFLTGMGRSGLAAQSFAMRLAHAGVPVHIVGEVTAPAIAAGDGLIAISSSGATATTIARLSRARQMGGRTALVTCRGPHDAADLVIVLQIPLRPDTNPPEFDSVLVMGGAFEVAADLFTELVVLEIVRRSGLSNADLFKRHFNLE